MKLLRPSYYYRLFRENKYLFFLNVFEQLFFFLVFLVFARMYSVEKYGELITIFTLANVFITFLNFGLPAFLQREAAIDRNKSSILLSRILKINILVFFLYLVFIFLYYELFYRAIPLKLFLVSIIPVYLYSNINILNSVLLGLKEFKSQFISFLNSRIITIFIFLLFALIIKSSMEMLILIYSLGFLYQVILLIIKIMKLTGKFSFTLNLNGIPEILKISLPIGLAVLFNFLYDKIDILIISKFTDFIQVGYYNIGYGLYKSSSIAFSFILISGLTRVSYLSRRKYAVKLFFKKYLLVFTIIGVLIGLFLFFFSEYIIKLIYTHKFSDSIIILRITSLAVLGLALNNLTGVILNGLGLFRKNMYVAFTGLIINIILNVIFIPLYGIIAAAIISIVTEYFIFVFDLFFIKKFLNAK